MSDSVDAFRIYIQVFVQAKHVFELFQLIFRNVLHFLNAYRFDKAEFLKVPDKRKFNIMMATEFVC